MRGGAISSLFCNGAVAVAVFTAVVFVIVVAVVAVVIAVVVVVIVTVAVVVIGIVVAVVLVKVATVVVPADGKGQSFPSGCPNISCKPNHEFSVT